MSRVSPAFACLLSFALVAAASPPLYAQREPTPPIAAPAPPSTPGLKDGPPDASTPPAQSSADHKTMATAAVVALIIAASVVGYKGNCACPQNIAANGSSCGKRAAYHRPGGWKPLCFASDVTAQMIDAFRKTGQVGAALALIQQP